MDQNTVNQLLEVRSKLRSSAAELLQWKLYKASKWSAEALCGMADLPVPSTVGGFFENTDDESPLKNRHANQNQPAVVGKYLASSMSLKEQDLYLLASTLFDCKEFDRCAYFLRDVTHPNLKFLKLYSKYLSWDKKTQENLENILTSGKSNGNDSREDAKPFGTGILRNYDFEDSTQQQFKSSSDVGNGDRTNIPTILKELNSCLEDEKEHQEEAGLGSALLHYLRGVLLKRQNVSGQALQEFIISITLYPYNWTCWYELLNCLTRSDEALLLLKHLREKVKDSEEDVSEAKNEHIMLKFFKLSLFQEFSGNIDDFIEDLDYLLTVFPNFTFLKTQHALINYHYMDYVNAELIFDQIIKLDPYRLDDLDTYSNILYVMQKPSKLAYLAQFTSGVDRFRPETCCIVANYYSAKQEHEKSIMYFRRALTLNKNCTSAWTLMGHEFVELKNSHAAIESYRRAVDINPRDFKAWYGLGQAYEVLDMHLYSLYYFQKACALKPLDKRMWQALASCYEKLSKKDESIKCYERALQLSISSDHDTAILYRLALLYERIQDVRNCRKYMMKCVKAEQNTDGLVTEETAKARLWLARYECKNKNFTEAYNYAVGVTHGTSQEIEEARTIARECRRRME